MFHAIKGCDTVSSFVGYGKKKAWTSWNALPELTNALLEMCQLRNDEQPEDAMTIIQRFIIYMIEQVNVLTLTKLDENYLQREHQ